MGDRGDQLWEVFHPKQVIQHMLTSSVAQRRTNNCHFIYDEVNQREKKQLRPWLNIYTMLALQWLAVSQRTFPRAESCACTRRKQHKRLYSYRHWLVFLQDFRLVHNLNHGWFLYKRKEEQKLTSRYNHLCDFLWMSGGLHFSAPNPRPPIVLTPCSHFIVSLATMKTNSTICIQRLVHRSVQQLSIFLLLL